MIGRLKRGGVGGELNERDAKGDVHRPMMETRAWVEPRRTLPVLRLPSSRAWSRAVRRAVSPLSLFAPRGDEGEGGCGEKAVGGDFWSQP